MKGENEITEKLLKRLNKDGLIHVVPARTNSNYIIRFTVTSYYTTDEDITRDWKIIQSTAENVLKDVQEKKELIEEMKKFQSSLLLSNVPQTPKVVNASFLAFFPDRDLTYDIIKDLTKKDYSISHLPLKPRRKPKYLIKSNHRGLSFDQNCSKSCGSDLIVPRKIRVDSCGEQQNVFDLSLDELTLNGDRENITNGKKYFKQASLDSKIEHIFDEADEAEFNGCNGEND